MHSVLSEAAALQELKGEDYKSKGSESKKEYFPYDDASYLTMIHTKVRRLESLAFETKTANFESAYDSVLDLINYASFYGAFLKEQKKK
jgi:hypothetical protein